MGAKIGEYIKKAKPNGGKICTIEGNPGADNILRRAQGMRDALTGQKGLAELKGEGGWTEVAGCPVFTNDDGAKGVQAMTDILAANPDLDAFGIMGGWPLFGAPQPYRDLFWPAQGQDRQPTSSSSAPPTRSATKWRSPRTASSPHSSASGRSRWATRRRRS